MALQVTVAISIGKVNLISVEDVDNREVRIKRLLYQSWYRGCKETDKLLGHFARAHLPGMTDADIDAFEAIMQEQDWDIWNIYTKKAEIPAELKSNRVFMQLMAFELPGILQE